MAQLRLATVLFINLSPRGGQYICGFSLSHMRVGVHVCVCVLRYGRVLLINLQQNALNILDSDLFATNVAFTAPMSCYSTVASLWLQ